MFNLLRCEQQEVDRAADTRQRATNAADFRAAGRGTPFLGVLNDEQIDVGPVVCLPARARPKKYNQRRVGNLRNRRREVRAE